jgi:hypothetical protein
VCELIESTSKYICGCWTRRCAVEEGQEERKKERGSELSPAPYLHLPPARTGRFTLRLLCISHAQSQTAVVTYHLEAVCQALLTVRLPALRPDNCLVGSHTPVRQLFVYSVPVCSYPRFQLKYQIKALGDSRRTYGTDKSSSPLLPLCCPAAIPRRTTVNVLRTPS